MCIRDRCGAAPCPPAAAPPWAALRAATPAPCITAVSYTHLDVYKRQTIICSARPIRKSCVRRRSTTPRPFCALKTAASSACAACRCAIRCKASISGIWLAPAPGRPSVRQRRTAFPKMCIRDRIHNQHLRLSHHLCGGPQRQHRG